MSEAFLQVENLRTHFPVERGMIFRRRIGTVKAVDGVSLALAQGEIRARGVGSVRPCTATSFSWQVS